MAISNSQLAIQMETLIQAWTLREREYAAWSAGSPTGGPQGDGRYPLTDGLGITKLVLSPAALADGVAGPAATALAAVEAVAAIRDGISAQVQRVLDLQVLASASETASKRWRDEAATARDYAQNSEANASVHRVAVEAALAQVTVDTTHLAEVVAEVDLRAAEVAANAVLALTALPARDEALAHAVAAAESASLSDTRATAADLSAASAAASATSAVSSEDAAAESAQEAAGHRQDAQSAAAASATSATASATSAGQSAASAVRAASDRQVVEEIAERTTGLDPARYATLAYVDQKLSLPPLVAALIFGN